MPTKEDINYSLLPFHMQEGMKAYLEIGRPTGDFLFYILSNNFVAAAYHADNINQHLLLSYCNFLYNEVPKDAWGKEETVWTWMKHHGFFGLEVKEGVEYSVGYWMQFSIHGLVTDRFDHLKPCFMFTPSEPTEDTDEVPIYCIFQFTRKGDEYTTKPIYHWTNKSWFPGPPLKEQEQTS